MLLLRPGGALERVTPLQRGGNAMQAKQNTLQIRGNNPSQAP
jgi:hypothetical protein